MRSSTGEMPFLEHLEELRLRILRALAALIAGFALGLLAVNRLELVSRIKVPIEAFLPEGKLTVLGPTDPIMIVLKLSFAVGLVLASPYILYQIWAFLSPALYEKERKAMVPALIAGLVLFLIGAAGAWIFVVPKALSVLLNVQADVFLTQITVDRYFAFVLQVVLAMGVSTEVPLLMILLTAIGLTTPARLSRFRRIAIVLSFIAGALLSPGGDMFTMLMMTVPLLLLYEIGVAGSALVYKRRLRREAAAALVLLLGLGVTGAAAQDPPPPPPAPTDTLPADTTARPAGRVDTASARRLGLPSAPTRTFPAPDSLMAALLRLSGFESTRYMADTATFFGGERRLQLAGRAITDRAGAILEAELVSYVDQRCEMIATGDPRLFDQGSVLIGTRIRFDTCVQRGVVQQALTTVAEQGADWYIRGNLAVDSVSSRLYAAHSEMTSCDLPTPHYHFATKEVKWVSKSMLVGRPAVLYIRDVPIAWLPFIFQETRPGRRSGILVPQFGFNDIVRPNSGYQRQITDFGYYWAINDYLDAQLRFHWYSGSWFGYDLTTQYRWLDRFINGSFTYNKQNQSGGGSATNISWDHRQEFNNTTSFIASLRLSSDTRVVTDNAIDPSLTTQNLSSSLNFTKRFSWGQLTLGGTRRQTLGDDAVTQTLPTLALTPKPLALGTWATWSPTVNFTNSTNTSARTYLVLQRPDGGVDSIEATPSTRTSTFNLATPFRLGSFNWQNSINVQDMEGSRATPITERIPDLSTPDPTDSVTVTRIAGGTFNSSVDWTTSFSLPVFFNRSWKVVPAIGVTNATSGAFAVRNERTNGSWAVQGKRLNFSLSAAPALFGFYGGFGPFERIRHGFKPSVNWNYAPEASIPLEYAEAVAAPNQDLVLTSPPRQSISFRLSQDFEAKERRAEGDTNTTTPQNKVRLLSIQTSDVSYDFEQAKLAGRTGWTTPTVQNQLQTDLLPGFSLNLTHDLWEGQVGTDTARFAPFLSSLSTRFSISARTLRGIGAMLGLGGDPPRPEEGAPAPAQPGSVAQNPFQRHGLVRSNMLGGARQPFSMNIDLTLQRFRQIPDAEPRPSNNSLGFSTSFSPTRYWGISWRTQYNLTGGKFEDHQVMLMRDMHDWRAGFNFVKNPNGNFAFYFSIHLIDLPEIKTDYNQTSIVERP